MSSSGRISRPCRGMSLRRSLKTRACWPIARRGSRACLRAPTEALEPGAPTSTGGAPRVPRFHQLDLVGARWIVGTADVGSGSAAAQRRRAEHQGKNGRPDCDRDVECEPPTEVAGAGSRSRQLGADRVQIRTELLELVADPGGLLEPEVVRGGEHLLL